jgi:hypothetical protein
MQFAGSLISHVASKAIELARTLKPDDAMRVRANEVKVATGTHVTLVICCISTMRLLLTLIYIAYLFPGCRVLGCARERVPSL